MRGEGVRGRALGWLAASNRPAGRRLGPGAAVRLAPLRRPSLAGERGGRREEAGSRGTGSCAATWVTASGRSPESELLALRAGRRGPVPGALR